MGEKCNASEKIHQANLQPLPLFQQALNSCPLSPLMHVKCDAQRVVQKCVYKLDDLIIWEKEKFLASSPWQNISFTLHGTHRWRWHIYFIYFEELYKGVFKHMSEFSSSIGDSPSAIRFTIYCRSCTWMPTTLSGDLFFLRWPLPSAAGASIWKTVHSALLPCSSWWWKQFFKRELWKRKWRWVPRQQQLNIGQLLNIDPFFMYYTHIGSHPWLTHCYLQKKWLIL